MLPTTYKKKTSSWCFTYEPYMLPTTYERKPAYDALTKRPRCYVLRIRENQLLILHQHALDDTYYV